MNRKTIFNQLDWVGKNFTRNCCLQQLAQYFGCETWSKTVYNQWENSSGARPLCHISDGATITVDVWSRGFEK